MNEGQQACSATHGNATREIQDFDHGGRRKRSDEERASSRSCSRDMPEEDSTDVRAEEALHIE
jgi:hypothetical protein